VSITEMFGRQAPLWIPLQGDRAPSVEGVVRHVRAAISRSRPFTLSADAGLPLPAADAVGSPWTDMSLNAASLTSKTDLDRER
jgi:hypothetical protein